MSEILNGLPLLQLLGLNLPDDVSKGAEIATPGSIQNFIGARRTNMPGRTLLLDLVQQFPCSMKPDAKLKWAVEDSASREPGFSDGKLDGFNPQHPQATIASHDVAAALIINEQARDESYKRHIITKDVVRNVVAYCEDQLINGCDEKIIGLLSFCGKESIEANADDKGRIAFYCRALKKYASDAKRTPTHIVLPFREVLLLHMEQQENVNICLGKAARGFPLKLFGIPIIVSDALPEDSGLILAVDDIILPSYPGLKWDFGHKGKGLPANDSAIILSFTMGLLIKHPKAVAKLNLERKKKL